MKILTPYLDEDIKVLSIEETRKAKFTVLRGSSWLQQYRYDLSGTSNCLVSKDLLRRS